MLSNEFEVKCDHCFEIVQEPYIECCECDVSLCTSCFSAGSEVKSHKNFHNYSVRKNTFPVFENCNWTAKEECRLLSALATHGYGNWEEISKSVHTRTKLECQEHYKKYYIDSVQYGELDVIPSTEQSMFPKPVIPYLYSSQISYDPPRNNISDPHLAGYNAFRSEFELSYDNYAESIFNIEDDYSDSEEDSCMDALKISLVSALNNRLRERDRRYRIIKNHGLIMPNKLTAWMLRFDSTLTRINCEKLVSFMQFMSGIQFDAFMESMNLESELFQKILRLCEYRKLGIKSFYGIRTYKQARKEHEIVKKEQKLSTMSMAIQYANESDFDVRATLTKNVPMHKVKKPSKPLDIVDLPGYHLLSTEEATLCSNLRIIPKNFLQYKEILCTENNKIGSLRLYDARRLIKIDVNKTKQIYEHLAAEGVIMKHNK